MATETRYRKSLSNHNEVAHIWAQQVQGEGYAGNMFFREDSIYSYGCHFRIARFVRKNGETVVLFNSAGYSSSTAKHKSIVRRAISHYKVYTVPHLDGFTSDQHEKNVAHFEEEANDLIKKAVRARTSTEWLLNSAIQSLMDMKHYASLFDVTLTEPQQALINQMEEGTLLSPETREKLRQKEAERKRIALEVNKHKIEEWINGERNTFPSSVEKIFLRRSGDNVQTSHGVTVTALEARLLYRKLKSNAPVKGATISHFKVVGFNGKVLTIGCHKILMTEIERFAKTQNW